MVVSTSQVVPAYLALLDAQRETALAALDGLSENQIWIRPSDKEWCIGEILSHVCRANSSMLSPERQAWKYLYWYGVRKRDRPYQTTIQDLYQTGKFPMWIGIFLAPRHTAKKSVPLEQLVGELRQIHQQVREFYTGKDEALLGNIKVYDPLVGSLNLILTMRVGIYHDQLHFEDVIKLATSFT